MLQWRYDSGKSLCVKWNVTYTETDKDTTDGFNINTASARDVVIDSLTPGLTYTIYLFAVTTNDVVSQTAAQVEATVSKCKCNVLRSPTRIPNIIYFIAVKYMEHLDIACCFV